MTKDISYALILFVIRAEISSELREYKYLEKIRKRPLVIWMYSMIKLGKRRICRKDLQALFDYNHDIRKEAT